MRVESRAFQPEQCLGPVTSGFASWLQNSSGVVAWFSEL